MTTAVPASPPAGSAIGPRLSILMFLQFFLWGAWFVTLGPYMNAKGFAGADVGNAYSTAPIGAILAPFFLGIIADRFFPSQIVMGLLHILGGGLLLLAPGAVNTQDSTLFIAILLGHFLCYMPTLGLSNTVAFHAMTNPEKQFPLVRVWGTIGWIVAGLIVAQLARHFAGEGADEAARASQPHFFYLAGASGMLLGIYSFSLPHTPAPMRGKPFRLGSILGVDSLALLKDRNFLVFALASLLICIPLAAYYSFAGVYAGAVGIQDVPVKMSFGQMSEIFFMLVMPLFFARLGVKWMLAVGMLAWVVRYGLFAGAWNPASGHLTYLVLTGIILHGICYDFFFVTGQIYTEQRAPAHIRAQAQGFLVLITQGVGMLIGNQVFGRLVDHYTTKSLGADGKEVASIAWQTIWIWPTAFAGAILLGFLLLFRNSKPAQLSS